jgi:uncharacterized membrane protein
MQMKLSAPKTMTFWIGVLVGLLGFLGVIFKIPVLTANAYWFTFVGFVILALGSLVKGL